MNLQSTSELPAIATRTGTILDAVGFAAERFLEAEDWAQPMRAILERLGTAVAVSRVYLAQNLPDAGEAMRARRRFVWIAPDLQAQLADRAHQDLFLQSNDLGRWAIALGAGEAIGGPTHTFPPVERSLLEAHAIRSIVVVPIFTGAGWWGQIGVDDCWRERAWSITELHALKTTASLIGNAIGRTQEYTRLCENEARYRQLVERSPVPILVQSNGLIAFANQACVGLLAATTAKELVGTPLLDLIHPDHRARADARGRKLQTPPLPDEPVEETLVRLDRCLIDVEMTSIPTTYLGKPATQIVIRDITEQKRSTAKRRAVERRLLETQKLESLGALAGGIAHEFNNLLMGMLGNASLASRELPPDSPAQQNLRIIEDTASRAAELTNQLLIYSGRKPFTLQLTDLNLIVEEVSRVAQVSFGRNTSFTLDLARLPSIEADTAQLRQLIVNLLNNAAEAIGEAKGRLSVSTDIQQLSSAYLATTYLSPELPSGEYVCLTIADDGPGMDAATQARMFEPFFTTKFPGRGLGLAGALGVIRGQRGALTVRSAPGQGCIFTVYFPSGRIAASLANRQPGDGAELPRPAPDTVVLLVEDDTDVRVLATRVLERLGFGVLAAADGHAGVELFRAQADGIACVLLDIHMPRMDGRQALGEILRIRPDARVLLMTGDDDWQSTGMLNDLRLAGVVYKPFSPDSLHAQIRRAIAPH